PHGRIWAACYMDSSTECFEIRTEYEDCPGSVVTLYHKEYTIGTALTDFLYVNLDVFSEHLKQLKVHLTEIRAGRNVERHFIQIFDTAIYWLRQSALFAPLAASMQRQRLFFDQGKKLSLEEVERQMVYYQELQPKLLFLATHCFELDASENMKERYLRQRAEFFDVKAPEGCNYPPLTYGVISFGMVMKGGNGFFPYDDACEGLGSTYRNDIQDFIAETLNAETPADFVQFVLAEYLRKDLHFRICKYCGRYFGITGNPKTEFCDRLIDGSTKTCKETGSFRLYEKRKLENPAVRDYKRSYKAHNARIRYGTMTREAFSAWSLEAREKRDLCVAGKLSQEDFTAWLDSDRQS
ncbi:MAG: DUF6076 domain-containing protein, partial [Clostridia bacterium]